LAAQGFASSWRGFAHICLKVFVAAVRALGSQRAVFDDALQTRCADSQCPDAVYGMALKSPSRLHMSSEVEQDDALVQGMACEAEASLPLLGNNFRLMPLL